MRARFDMRARFGTRARHLSNKTPWLSLFACLQGDSFFSRLSCCLPRFLR